jgi:hypothetical protein
VSKGHIEALRAMREAAFASRVTKVKPPVTKLVTPAVTLGPSRIGRPKVHASAAEKQKAYRDRKAKQ